MDLLILLKNNYTSDFHNLLFFSIIQFILLLSFSFYFYVVLS